MKREEEKQIQDYLGRPARYCNIDGVMEISAGLGWLGLGMWVWIPSIAPRASIWQSMWILLPLFLAWMWLVNSGSQAFKRRVTYPRTGFVSYPAGNRKAPGAQVFLLAAVAGATASALVYLMARKGLQPILLVGGPLTVCYGVMARPLFAWKWAILTLMAAGTLGLIFLPGGFHQQMAIGMAFYSGMYMVSGLITLTLYLRRSKPAGQVAE